MTQEVQIGLTLLWFVDSRRAALEFGGDWWQDGTDNWGGGCQACRHTDKIGQNIWHCGATGRVHLLPAPLLLFTFNNIYCNLLWSFSLCCIQKKYFLKKKHDLNTERYYQFVKKRQKCSTICLNVLIVRLVYNGQLHILSALDGQETIRVLIKTRKSNI